MKWLQKLKEKKQFEKSIQSEAGKIEEESYRKSYRGIALKEAKKRGVRKAKMKASGKGGGILSSLAEIGRNIDMDALTEIPSFDLGETKKRRRRKKRR